MKTISLDELKKFLKSDDMLLEGIVTDSGYNATQFCRFLKVPIAKEEHTVTELYLQSLYVDENNSVLFEKASNFELCCYVVDGERWVLPSYSLLSKYNLWDNYEIAQKNNPNLIDELVRYLASTTEITDDDIKRFTSDKDVEAEINETAISVYIFGKKDEYDSDNEDRLTSYIKNKVSFTMNDFVKFLASPSKWAKEIAERERKNNPNFDERVRKSIVISKCVSSKIAHFKSDKNSPEHTYKDILLALKGRATVRIIISANGQEKETKVDATRLITRDTIHRKYVSTFAILPYKKSAEIKDFLSENLPQSFRQNEAFRYSDDIPFSCIVKIISGKKVLWESPDGIGGSNVQ